MLNSESKIECNCQICQRNRRLQGIQNKLPEEDSQFLENLNELLMVLDEENHIFRVYLENLKTLYPKIYQEVCVLENKGWEEQIFPERNI